MRCVVEKRVRSWQCRRVASKQLVVCHHSFSFFDCIRSFEQALHKRTKVTIHQLYLFMLRCLGVVPRCEPPAGIYAATWCVHNAETCRLDLHVATSRWECVPAVWPAWDRCVPTEASNAWNNSKTHKAGNIISPCDYIKRPPWRRGLKQLLEFGRLVCGL